MELIPGIITGHAINSSIFDLYGTFVNGLLNERRRSKGLEYSKNIPRVKYASYGP